MRALFGGSKGGHPDAELLSAFLDRQTTQDERTRVETHLHTCANCRAEMESLRSTVALLQALPRVPVPHAFTLSEAQLGIRRPATNPGWYGGVLRGLGAVAGLLLVAFLAVSLLQQPGWTPGQTIARAPTIANTVAPASTAVVAPAAPAAEVLVTAPAQAVPPQEAPAPLAVTQSEAQPTATLQPSPMAELAALPPPAIEEGAGSAADTTAATEAPVVAMAAKAAETPEDSARAMGRGGGGPSASSLPADALTPEPTAPAVALAEALPEDIRAVYADLRALYAVDPKAGVRQVLAADGINMPQLSPDQKWVVYRTFKEGVLQLWAVPWEGGESRLLLSDDNLSKENLPAGYAERHFSDSRWMPGNGHVLSLTLSVTGGMAAPELPVVTELWHLDVEAGELTFVAPLGGAYRPFYSLDGSRFATLQYGTETEPQGTLVLYKTNEKKPAEGRVALTFPAGPGKPYFDSQIAWAKDNRFLLAIPDADPQFQNPIQLNGAALYQISGGGDAKEIGRVDGFQAAWSPTGEEMMYSRYVSEAMDQVELYLARGDGSAPELYASTKMGAFMGWSPDGSHFLYHDDFQVYAGARGQEPLRLSNGVSLWDPRWVTGKDFLSLHDLGEAGWWWTLRSVDGKAAGLMDLPREVMLDVVAPTAR